MSNSYNATDKGTRRMKTPAVRQMIKGIRTLHPTQEKQAAPLLLQHLEQAVQWLEQAGIAHGPVFRRLDRWGHLAEDGFNSNSLIPLLRRIFRRAGVPAELYTSHSLRRGFATWAAANGWDIKSLMTYVGWKDMKSVMRYIDTADSFGELAIDQSRPPSPLPREHTIVLVEGSLEGA